MKLPPHDFFDAVAVTPSDAVDLARPANGFVVAVAGLVNVITKGGTTLNIPAAAGIPMRIAVTRIRAAGTTATGIVALH